MSDVIGGLWVLAVFAAVIGGVYFVAFRDLRRDRAYWAAVERNDWAEADRLMRHERKSKRWL